jgi:hypothetical protein
MDLNLQTLKLPSTSLQHVYEIFFSLQLLRLSRTGPTMSQYSTFQFGCPPYKRHSNKIKEVVEHSEILMAEASGNRTFSVLTVQ